MRTGRGGRTTEMLCRWMETEDSMSWHITEQ
jgi:hypothetical protein